MHRGSREEQKEDTSDQRPANQRGDISISSGEDNVNKKGKSHEHIHKHHTNINIQVHQHKNEIYYRVRIIF